MSYLVGERAGLAEHQIVTNVNTQGEDTGYSDADDALRRVLIMREVVQIVEEGAHYQHTLLDDETKHN